MNAERYISQELKELEHAILSAQDTVTALEYQLFCQLKEQVCRQVAAIQASAAAVAQVDVLNSFATVAADNRYCMPQVDDSDTLTITQGRHPVVEKVLKGTPFVPNDTHMDRGEDRCAIITGPNMAGKSTYMRQVALIVLMAQMGSFVPAQSAHIGVVDRVFTRIGASDDLAAGQSTFMVEMTEVAALLKSATRRSLLILDEIGRGTSTYDGMSIARAVLEYCADPKRLGAKTLFATHYHELTVLERPHPRCEELSHRRQKEGGGRDLPAEDPPGRRGPELWHRGGPPGRRARGGHPPGPGDPDRAGGGPGGPSPARPNAGGGPVLPGGTGQPGGAGPPGADRRERPLPHPGVESVGRIEADAGGVNHRWCGGHRTGGHSTRKGYAASVRLLRRQRLRKGPPLQELS